MAPERRRRANGEASREKVLDAATEIAGERGYEGTSISLVSERSGLPASSIYWHFKDKDELIAEVIERSYRRWTAEVIRQAEVPDGLTGGERFRESMRQSGAAIAEFPDFLRLGLLLILERRPEEPTARKKFIEVRQATRDSTRAYYSAQFPDLDADDIETLLTVTLAMADGLFVAQDADELDLRRSFDLLATAVLGTADQLRAAKRAPARPPAKGRPSPKRTSTRRTARTTSR